MESICRLGDLPLSYLGFTMSQNRPHRLTVVKKTNDDGAGQETEKVIVILQLF